MPVDVVVVDPTTGLESVTRRGDNLPLESSAHSESQSLSLPPNHTSSTKSPRESVSHAVNDTSQASLMNLSQTDSLDNTGQQQDSKNDDSAVNIIRNLEDYLAAHNQLESGDEEDGMGDELISLENILPLPFDNYDAMSKELTQSMSESFLDSEFRRAELEILENVYSQLPSTDAASQSGSNSSNLLHFDDVSHEKSFDIKMTDPFGPPISTQEADIFEQQQGGEMNLTPSQGKENDTNKETKKSVKTFTKTSPAQRGSISSYFAPPVKSFQSSKPPSSKSSSLKPLSSTSPSNKSDLDKLGNKNGRPISSKVPLKRASSAPRKSLSNESKSPTTKIQNNPPSDTVKSEANTEEQDEPQGQLDSASDSLLSVKSNTSKSKEVNAEYQINGHEKLNTSDSNNKTEEERNRPQKPSGNTKSGTRSGLIIKETVASRSRRRWESQRRQEEKSANSFFDCEYYTPLQRKEIEVKELRAQLLEAYQVVENRELELEVCHFEKDTQIRKAEAEKHEAVSQLEQDIQTLQHDIDLWRMRTITVEQKHQNVIGVIEKVKKEQEEKEKKHREMYLEMYQKGKNSIVFERQVELEKLALESPEKVSKSELEAQLRKVDEEIQRWQQARLNEHYGEVKKPDTEAEAKLKFIRDPFFHYLVEQKREISDGHLDTLVNMFQYSQVQMNTINKSLENRRKHGKM